VTSGQACWTIEPTEPFFAGHYPGLPILPGVLLLDHVHRAATADRDPIPLTGVESVRFLAPVLPGDRIGIAWNWTPDAQRCTAEVSTGRVTAARMSLRYGVPTDLAYERAAESEGRLGGPAEIRRLLPHRYPMLLVDRIEQWHQGQWLTALKAVTVNEPWTQTSGDDFPPALLIESWCQAAGILAGGGEANSDVRTGRVVLLGMLKDVWLHCPVRPGDVVRHRVRLLRSAGDNAILAGEAAVDGKVVLRVGQAVTAVRAWPPT
jgi:3-hydroxymyristoyl/3-hydroxydecanoyl-(acyl carrier protein) dehydratase